MSMQGGWVLEIDIRKFFDHLDHRHVHAILRQRVRDGVLLRLIGKWLKAGVLEAGSISYPEAGSPQGGVISPLLANIYLHEVMDTWFERTVKPRLYGRGALVRYADDAVMVFEREDDARRVLAVLAKRFAKYGLSLHPEKTRLVAFRRPPRRPRQGGSSGPRSGTFDFLGFTHFWSVSRNGNWVVSRKTARDRFTRALRSVARWCRTWRHLPFRQQWDMLGMKLRGHYAYYGITGNSAAIRRFRVEVERVWHKWLSRRSQQARLCWTRFSRLLRRFPLPAARLIRPVT
jgi:group II intron reverse transcriptase/maturase